MKWLWGLLHVSHIKVTGGTALGPKTSGKILFILIICVVYSQGTKHGLTVNHFSMNWNLSRTANGTQLGCPLRWKIVFRSCSPLVRHRVSSRAVGCFHIQYEYTCTFDLQLHWWRIKKKKSYSWQPLDK